MSDRSAQEVIRDLETGRMSWGEVKEILRQKKTPSRFSEYRETLAETTPFGDRVLVRVGEYLFVVVEPDGSHSLRCGECEHNFGDPRINWKLSSRVRVRRTLEEFLEVYLYEEVCPEPGIAEIREYFCPGCFTLLCVECVPTGYPPVFEFLPDLNSIYRDILHEPVPSGPDEAWTFEDLTMSKVEAWASNNTGSTQGAAR
ncbi:MAG TPA: acetone carboxylase subunit gamma [Streptosporangiaceae bacterium]|nr:acetone carboxylase subunit gamma [Streptosporangiaceae bacterium]